MVSEIAVTILSNDRILADAIESVLAEALSFQVVPTPDADRGSSPGVDVVLIDASASRETALARTWTAQERFNGAHVIVLGLDREDESVLDFIQAGAAGYVLKNASPATFVETIRAAHSGQALCSPAIATAVLARISRLASEDPCHGGMACEQLTGRELGVLALMAQGLGNKEIGRSLRITVQTVKNHVHSILEKLGVHRRREAVRIACERGLLGSGQGPMNLF
ncbi:MAG TPA: response regulator transcription factor [Thermoanaerobaculia bacterium]